MPSAIMMFVSPVPSTVTIAIAKRIGGNAIHTSMTRMTTRSRVLPK
jgi:hypothetical protein